MSLIRDYTRAFIIGSSFPVVLAFYLGVANTPNNIKNYSYETYTLLAPIYFGLMNMLALLIEKNSKLSLREIYIILGIISPIIVISIAMISKGYNFSRNEWFNYSVRLIIKHFLTYNLIIYYLMKYI